MLLLESLDLLEEGPVLSKVIDWLVNVRRPLHIQLL